MNRYFTGITTTTTEFLDELGGISRFSVKVVKEIFRRPFEHEELLKQSYSMGYKTLPLILITGFIIGLVLSLQSRPTLVEFNAESELPGLISISIVREIGPVITALLCAGKISSGIGAELGSMRVTEQIDAMEVSGTRPIKYVVVTRVLATTFTVPILVFFSVAVSFYGSYVAINMYDNMSMSLFLDEAFEVLYFKDIIPATLKTFFFGFFIGLIGSYKGYFTKKGTEGVGESSNSAVVTASLSIFLIDLLAVQVTGLLY